MNQNRALEPHEVQSLALSGYKFHCSRHLVLQIVDAERVRGFLRAIVQRGLLKFGPSALGNAKSAAVNIGFTFAGLDRLRVDDLYLLRLRQHAEAFAQGAARRAARRLGDTGASAPDRWAAPFAADRAHLVLSIHADLGDELNAMQQTLAGLTDVARAFVGWTEPFDAEHLTKTDRDQRSVHFGFRDGISIPQIDETKFDPVRGRHRAGELVLGYDNDSDFNPWDGSMLNGKPWDDRSRAFFRNGSFCVLRRIEQDEAGFNRYIKTQARRLVVSPDYLKAKICGRWPNGAPLMAGDSPGSDGKAVGPRVDNDFDFSDDEHGYGCPLGSHIRRTNPRADRIAPSRRRPLFRRGMPYGPKFEEGPKAERGLMGLFFCASIEDQFETVMSEWVEKMPMGPPSLGNAKDPLIGQHDDRDSVFHIPRRDGEAFELQDFVPFTTTRGTLYAFFPGRGALQELAGLASANDATPRVSAARAGAAPPSPTASAPTPHGASPAGSAAATAPVTAPPDRFCDIVMEGGITSGIIYTTAVAELAKWYRFQSIGGSSIGAFAAALTAAAEYLRRQGSMAGFQGIAKLPGELAERDGGRDTRLFRLFRPQPQTRRLFAIFVAALGHKTHGARIRCGLAAALRQYRLPALIAAGLTFLLALGGPLAMVWSGLLAVPPGEAGPQLLALASWALATALSLLATVALTLAAWIGRDVLRASTGNGFGLCRGWGREEREGDVDQPDLAGYLHASIQRVAGRHPVDDEPLTFGDLWQAPGGPQSEGAQRSIDLQVYATNLNHARPYRFPLDEADDMGNLYFIAEQWEDYFPAHIVRHMVRHAQPYEPMNSSRDPPATDKTKKYLKLPQAQLPVVVAARLAMSFPGLISAVPVWAIDYERRHGNRDFARCWLSDGGLCSNFPIHLFDSFIPRWPTFGISLQERIKHRPEQCIWLPDTHDQGRADIWNHGTDDDQPAAKRASSFLSALWRAAWRWNDMTMMRMPGVRDRVVRVYLESGEGGVNIRMEPELIARLARQYGGRAAAAFIAKFAVPGSCGWDEHRWVRFNRLLIALRHEIDGIKAAAELDRHATPLQEQIWSALNVAPLRGSRSSPSSVLSSAQVRELGDLLTVVGDLEQKFRGAGDHAPYACVPRPSLRVRHPT